MKIRKAKPKDRKKITNLYRLLYPHQKIKNMPIKFNAKTNLLVAEENNELVGFCWLNFIQFGIYRFGYIDDLFVKEEFRRKNVGERLIKTGLNWFKKLKTAAVFVTTGEKNKTAQKFYRSLKFKLSGPWFYMNMKKYKVNK
jgi:ribosomal protein S18 acetylase RimI-like enzyme